MSLNTDIFDALVWELGVTLAEPFLRAWSGVPSAALNHGRFDVPPGNNGEILDLIGMDVDECIGVIARWLARTREAEVSLSERQMLEVLVDNVQRVLDEQTKTNDSIAQVQAATDTIQAQLRAASPSRRVLGWAVSQISAYSMGLLSGASLPYLTELLHAFH